MPLWCFLAKAEDVKVPISDFKQRIALVAANENSPFGGGSVETLEEKIERKLTPEERRLFDHTDDGKWKEYQDDLISFQLPDHPLLVVEAVDKNADKNIRVIGGVTSMPDNTFERAYWLKAGDLHYGVILLKGADWLDEGLCMCGPIVYKKCLLKEGNLLEFSMLPNGKVKKVQALGGKHRAMLFEWTHSVIPQSAYFRIGRSMRLKLPARKDMEWKKELQKRRGWTGLVSWLEVGEGPDAVRALLGKPAKEEQDVWTFIEESWGKDGSGYQLTSTIDMTGGRYRGVTSHWQNAEALPPKPATVAWALARLESLRKQNTAESEKSRATTADHRAICDLFLQNAPHAGNDEWLGWTRLALEMTNMDWKDSRIKDVIVARYREPELPHEYSTQFLARYKVPNFQSMLLERSVYVLRHQDREGEIFQILDSMDPKAFAETIKLVVAHASINVRTSAYHLAHRLPNADGLMVLGRGLEESEVYARIIASQILSEVVEARDIPWLEQKLTAETNQEVAENIKEALEKARKAK